MSLYENIDKLKLLPDISQEIEIVLDKNINHR